MTHLRIKANFQKKASEDSLIQTFVDSWQKEMLAVTDGVKTTWPEEVSRASEALEERLEALLNEVEVKLHDGGFLG